MNDDDHTFFVLLGDVPFVGAEAVLFDEGEQGVARDDHCIEFLDAINSNEIEDSPLDWLEELFLNLQSWYLAVKTCLPDRGHVLSEESNLHV